MSHVINDILKQRKNALREQQEARQETEKRQQELLAFLSKKDISLNIPKAQQEAKQGMELLTFSSLSIVDKLAVYSSMEKDNPMYQTYQSFILQDIGKKLKRPDIIVESGKKGDKSEYLENLLQEESVKKMIINYGASNDYLQNSKNNISLND